MDFCGWNGATSSRRDFGLRATPHGLAMGEKNSLPEAARRDFVIYAATAESRLSFSISYFASICLSPFPIILRTIFRISASTFRVFNVKMNNDEKKDDENVTFPSLIEEYSQFDLKIKNLRDII